MPRQALIILVVLFSSLAQGSIAPPPGNLPRVVFECESGPNYNPCAFWVWDGSAYTSNWSNGAIGRLSVSKPGLAGVELKRTDAAGAAAGLTATYTAQWDGKSFTAGKLSFVFRGTSGTFDWTGNATLTPVLTDPPGNQNVSNGYSVPLTGYAYINPGMKDIHGARVSSLFGTQMVDFRILEQLPLSLGAKRPISGHAYVAPPDYTKGKALPEDFGVVAAIYADGTTFGDPKVVSLLIQHRRIMLAALAPIAATYCSLAQHGTTIADLSAALEKQHGEEDAHTSVGPDGEVEKSLRGEAYSSVLKHLTSRNSNHMQPAQAIKNTYGLLNQLRTSLAADPIRDMGGMLLIVPAEPVPCNFP